MLDLLFLIVSSDMLRLMIRAYKGRLYIVLSASML